MRIAGIILLVLSVVAFISSTRNVIAISSAGGGDSAYSVGYIVGSYMVPMFLLIGALICFDKHKKKYS